MSEVDQSNPINYDSAAEDKKAADAENKSMASQKSKTLLSQQRQRALDNGDLATTVKDGNSVKDVTSGKSPVGDASIANASKKTLGAPAEATLAKTKKKSRPAYLQSLNESEKQANFKIIEKMNKKISFLKNPRFRVNKAPIIMTEAINNKAALEPTSIKMSSFRIEPPILNFIDYQVNGVYEIPVKVTNVAQVSKRIKFIPPATENFTIRTFKYPSAKTGDVAPGMSLMLYVAFSAPSFADFDDVLTFVTEETSFKIPLKARRDPPSISLVNPMDCLNSWLGDRVDMAFRCVNTGGDGGFKFFCEKDEDDSKQTEPDTIRIGSFTLTPSEFYLYQGSAIDIYVSFNPEKEGKLDENLILACDNQTSEFYKLTGYGAMLDLDIIAVDHKEVNFKENPFETIYFENTNPTSESKRVIRVRNSSPIMVPFHWSVYKLKNAQKITLENEDTHYRVEPVQGKIPGGEYIDFEILFCPQHAEPYFEYADLIIEDIPISSVRNPPEGLKSFAQANTVKNSKVPMPTYVGSNTQFLSIPMIQFNLRGQGNSCQVDVEPSYCLFEGDTYINNEYSQIVKLQKKSEGQVRYKLRLEGKNKVSFDIDLQTQGKSLKTAPGGIIEGIIEAQDNDIDLKIVVKSKDRGECMAYFFIEIEDGPPVSFQVACQFMGPIIKCHHPLVDYGLVKVNSQQDFEIEVENQSPIQAELLIKNSKNQRLGFHNMVGLAQTTEKMRSDSHTICLIYDKPLYTKKRNQIIMDQYSIILEPYQKQSLLVSMVTTKTESVEEYFEIMVRDGESQYFQLLSEVQRPHISLNRVVMDLGKIYAGVPEYINPQSKHQKSTLVMKNYGNLPAHFRWEQKNDPNNCICKFEPSSGVIQPHQDLKIKMSVTVFVGGKLNELFLCDIQDMEMPLGFEMMADAYGLNVSYETLEDQSAALSTTDTSMKAKTMKDSKSNSLQILNFPNCTINKTSSQKFILKNLSGIMTHFNFQVLNYAPPVIATPKEKSELEKAKEYAEDMERRRAIEQQNMMTGGSMSNASVTNKKKKKVGFAQTSEQGLFPTMTTEKQIMRNRPILSDEHEQTQKFSSAVGETFTKTKQLEKEQSFYLSNNKGIAVVFYPQEGDLPPNSEVPITVTVYNNVCGKFDDRIVSMVKGLTDVEFPVSISISGSPIRVPPNQVGLNYNTIPPTLPIPTCVAKSKNICKTFKIKNTGIKSVQVDWKIFDLEDHQGSKKKDEDADLFDLDIVKNFAFDKNENPFKFEFQAIEPEPSDDSAFKIEPESCVIGSRSTHQFSVTFDPSKGTGKFRSIVLATPELSQEELEIQDATANLGSPRIGGPGTSSVLDLLKKGSLGIISLNLDALTINPYLSIDRKLKMDGEHHMRFRHWSINSEADKKQMDATAVSASMVDDGAPRKIQKLIFTNNTKADMIFNLNINGPFEIVKTKTNTGASHPLSGKESNGKTVQPKVEKMFCLQPLKIVEVHVKFLAPSPSDTAEWPMTILNERKGELVAYFANGDQQKLFLEGVLMRPKVQVLTDFLSKNDYAMDELDFGMVNVEKSRTIHIYLSNETFVTAKWMLNYVKFPKKTTIGHNTTTPWEVENMQKTDDPEVFEFSITAGTLKGKSLPLRKVPEGLLVPPVPKDEEEKTYMPVKILINFKPKQNVLYKSKFRFTTEAGIACDIILKGRGSYEEDHD